MTEKILYCSDLHIDRVAVDHVIIAKCINKQTNKEKCTIVVFAGDISDSLKLTYSFLSKINAKCLFVKGNHDHYKNEGLIPEAPENVVLLENSYYETKDYLILGATFWTNLGYSTQPQEIKNLSFSRLIDSVEIPEWTPEKQIYENKESRRFFEEFLSLRHYLKEAGKYDKNIHSELIKSPRDLSKLVTILKEKFQSYSVELIEKSISSIDKKIVCVTHHSPFIEEFLLHQVIQEKKPYYSATTLSPTALDDCTSHDLYSMKIGRTPFDDNPLEIYSYFNCDFNPHLDEDLIWIHGHTHQIEGVNSVKGINVHCNPAPCRYFNWKKEGHLLLKKASFKPAKIDKTFTQLAKNHENSIVECIEKIERLKALKWADRKTTRGVDSIVFLNTIDSLRLSCEQVFEQLNTLYFVLKISAMHGASLGKFQRLWSPYSANRDIYDILKEVEANVQNVKNLSDALNIAKMHNSFYFIMGGSSPKKLLQLSSNFLNKLLR